MKHDATDKEKKVSEIFLRYVAPLSEGAPKDITPEHLQSVLRFPTLIWNAVALKGWGKSNDYVKEVIDHLTNSGVPEIALIGQPMVRMWVQRKEEMFPDENWGIEDVIVYKDFGGELIIRVIARAPEKFKHQLPSAKYAVDQRSTLN